MARDRMGSNMRRLVVVNGKKSVELHFGWLNLIPWRTKQVRKVS